MSVASATAAARQAFSRVMLDSCTITRPAAGGTFDPDTGITAPDAASTVYSGVCWVHPAPRIAGGVLAGEEQITVGKYVVAIPYDTPGIEIDDVVTVIATGDDDLLATPLRVEDVPMGTSIAARRLACTADLG